MVMGVCGYGNHQRRLSEGWSTPTIRHDEAFHLGRGHAPTKVPSDDRHPSGRSSSIYVVDDDVVLFLPHGRAVGDGLVIPRRIVVAIFMVVVVVVARSDVPTSRRLSGTDVPCPVVVVIICIVFINSKGIDHHHDVAVVVERIWRYPLRPAESP
jgi:hypothetical protein